MQMRTAGLSDVAAVSMLLARAYPVLMAASYDAGVLAPVLPAMTKANPGLLASGTYYLAEAAGRVVGCGGWTFEAPGMRELAAGLAHLRHFATDPDRARRGIGRAIFDRCAAAAAERGAKCFQAFASLNAAPFYQHMGLRRQRVIAIPMGPDASLSTVLMEGVIQPDVR